MHTRATPLIAVAAMLAAGCSGSDDPVPEGDLLRTVEDSAGVSLHLNRAPRWQAGDGWTVGSFGIDLGETGSGPAHEFFQVWDATFLQDSLIAVSVGAELRLFDRAGAHVSTLGRRGEGPGEYSGIEIGLTSHGDSLVANDLLARRVTSYTPSLEFASTVGVSERRYRRGILSTEAGLVVHMEDPVSMEPGYQREASPILLLGAEAQLLDTVATLPGVELLYLPRGPEELRLEVSPFAKDGYLGTDGRRLMVGDASSFEYRIVDLDGAVRTIVRGERSLELTPERLRSERDALIGEDPSPALIDLWNEIVDAIPDPLVLPAYQSLEVDPDGFVWLEAFTGVAGALQPRRWDVFSDGHEWLGEVVLPAGFQALEFGRDVVVGVKRDSLSVETVQILPIEKR